MANIIDILTAPVSGEFTVDLEETEVDVTQFQVAFQTVLGFDTFDANDNFKILSAWVYFPYCFSSGTLSPWLRCVAKTVGAGTDISIGIGTNDEASIPVENNEVELGIYVPYSTVGEAFRLTGSADGKISMLNVPEVLDGETLYIYPALKVQHNLPLL